MTECRWYQRWYHRWQRAADRESLLCSIRRYRRECGPFSTDDAIRTWRSMERNTPWWHCACAVQELRERLPEFLREVTK